MTTWIRGFDYEREFMKCCSFAKFIPLIIKLTTSAHRECGRYRSCFLGLFRPLIFTAVVELCANTQTEGDMMKYAACLYIRSEEALVCLFGRPLSSRPVLISMDILHTETNARAHIHTDARAQTNTNE